MTVWCSPDGTALHPDTPHSLSDGERRWPVLDDVAWLRSGDDELRERAVHHLDADDPDGAAALLFADSDDWWDEPAPPPEQLRRVRAADSMREAVATLGLGRVGTYLLHRWSDPSWLAALALTAAHPPGRRPVVDLACGAGHLLRHLGRHGYTDLVGVDVVFAKLWLARRFLVGPDVALVCADLTAPWPVPDGPDRYVACHDALYFLRDKAAVVAAARRCAGQDGAVLLGHCHNAAHPAGASGLPLTAAEWTDLLPRGVAYSEEELTTATVQGRLPYPAATDELAGTEAVALADDPAGVAARPALLAPAAGTALRANPLYTAKVRHWPDEPWAAEYGDRAARYLPKAWPGRSDRSDPIRSRLLVDLPDHW